ERGLERLLRKAGMRLDTGAVAASSLEEPFDETVRGVVDATELIPGPDAPLMLAVPLVDEGLASLEALLGGLDPGIGQHAHGGLRQVEGAFRHDAADAA